MIVRELVCECLKTVNHHSGNPWRGTESTQVASAIIYHVGFEGISDFMRGVHFILQLLMMTTEKKIRRESMSEAYVKLRNLVELCWIVDHYSSCDA